MKTEIKDNKLIAEFMGDISSINAKVSFSKNCGVNDLQYHTSWDWLMPVVNKVRNITSYDRDKFDTEVIIHADKTIIRSGSYDKKPHSNLFFNKTINGDYNSMIHTYNAVLDFIKWYKIKE